MFRFGADVLVLRTVHLTPAVLPYNMMRRGPAYGAPVPPPGPAQRGPMPPRPPPPHLNPVSNVTNSSDFAAKDSRVFVGNLNTFALSKEDVDRIFGQYGLVTGISMHKGYAFVQYNHPGEARRSVAFENGNSYGGQILDLNIVSEPKKGGGPGAGPPKRHHSAPGMNDRSFPTRRPPPQNSPSIVQAAKRPRPDTPSTLVSNPSMQRSNLVTLSNSSSDHHRSVSVSPAARPRPTSTPSTSATRAAAAAAVKRAATTVSRSASVSQATSSSSVSAGTVAPGKDVLICGVCKMQFTSLHSLAQHKKIPCRLRTSCQCQTNPPKPPPEEKELDCATCDARFDSAWALCQHCHKEHDMSIFKTADGASNANNASGPKGGSKEAAEEKNGQDTNGAKKAKTETSSPPKK
ncbi:hypothetical protein ACOMHN_004422 [Nucella lapillus]